MNVKVGAEKRHAIAQAGPEVFFPPISSHTLNTSVLNYIMNRKDFHYGERERSNSGPQL